MTRMHFKVFAALVKEADMSKNEKVRFALALAKMCEEDNERFDIDRFKIACGI